MCSVYKHARALFPRLLRQFVLSFSFCVQLTSVILKFVPFGSGAPLRGPPRWLSGKRICLHCRRRGFNPWVERSHGGGHGNPLQYSCLGNLTESIGSQRVRCEQSN